MHPAGKKVVWLAFIALLYATSPSGHGGTGNAIAAAPPAVTEAAQPGAQCTRDAHTTVAVVQRRA